MESEYVEWRQLYHSGDPHSKLTDVCGVQMQCSGILYVSDLLLGIALFNKKTILKCILLSH
jgi:hypothetical protein